MDTYIHTYILLHRNDKIITAVDYMMKPQNPPLIPRGLCFRRKEQDRRNERKTREGRENRRRRGMLKKQPKRQVRNRHRHRHQPRDHSEQPRQPIVTKSPRSRHPIGAKIQRPHRRREQALLLLPPLPEQSFHQAVQQRFRPLHHLRFSRRLLQQNLLHHLCLHHLRYHQ